jgi:hypothetical protein
MTLGAGTRQAKARMAVTDLQTELIVASIAVDTLSLDPGNSADFAMPVDDRFKA